MLKGFIGFSHELVFIKTVIRSSGTLSVQLFQYLRQYQQQQHEDAPAVSPTILDLSYACRTLKHAAKVLDEQQLPPDRLKEISGSLVPVRNDLENLSKVFHSGQLTAATAEAFRLQVVGHLKKLTAVLSSVRFWQHQETLVLYYTGHTLVCRKQLPPETKLNICAGAALEDAANISQPVWEDQIGIYEHVGLKSGGERFYDPFFIARGPMAGQKFFIPGRVFIVLWSTDGWPEGDDIVSYEEAAVTADRMMYSAMEGSFTGPYEGPTRVRCFVVVEVGPRSALCLPVLDYVKSGVFKLLDQQGYGIIQHASRDVSSPVTEDGTSLVTLSIPATPERQVMTSGLDQIELPAMDQLPIGPLPEHARIDYRRWCEVELNVYTRNVGLVDRDTLLANVRTAQALS